MRYPLSVTADKTMAELAILSRTQFGRAKLDKEWLSRKEAALYLEQIGCPITAKTLANMASNKNAGNGPSFTRNGWKTVLYKRDDLDAWAKKRRTEIRSR